MNFSRVASEFEICEHWFHFFRRSFTVKDSDQRWGTIRKKIIALTTTFTFHSPTRELLAKGSIEWFSLGTNLSIEDGLGKPIGRLEEKIFKGLGKFYNEYAIYNAQNRIIGKSIKDDLFSTEIKILDPQGLLIATLKRPWIRLFRDKWKVKLHIQGVVDPRMIVMIAAFKTQADLNKRKALTRNVNDKVP